VFSSRWPIVWTRGVPVPVGLCPAARQQWCYWGVQQPHSGCSGCRSSQPLSGSNNDTVRVLYSHCQTTVLKTVSGGFWACRCQGVEWRSPASSAEVHHSTSWLAALAEVADQSSHATTSMKYEMWCWRLTAGIACHASGPQAGHRQQPAVLSVLIFAGITAWLH